MCAECVQQFELLAHFQLSTFNLFGVGLEFKSLWLVLYIIPFPTPPEFSGVRALIAPGGLDDALQLLRPLGPDEGEEVWL